MFRIAIRKLPLRIVSHACPEDTCTSTTNAQPHARVQTKACARTSTHLQTRRMLIPCAALVFRHWFLNRDFLVPPIKAPPHNKLICPHLALFSKRLIYKRLNKDISLYYIYVNMHMCIYIYIYTYVYVHVYAYVYVYV